MGRVWHASILLAIISLYSPGAERKVRIIETKSINQFKLARQKNLEQLKEIAHLIDLNAQEKETGNTLLHYAILLADIPLIGFLLSTRSVDPHLKNGTLCSPGRSPHEIARDSGDKTIEALLLRYELQSLYKNSFSISNLADPAKSNEPILTRSGRQ